MSKPQNDFFLDYMIYGFSYIQDDTILKMFKSIDNFGEIVNVENMSDDEEYTPEYNIIQNKFLQDVQNYLEEKYINENLETLNISRNIWSGVDDGSLEWHNDYLEGQDFCFLYYLDTMLFDGALYFKSLITNENRILYPKEGTLVWLNLTNKYLHKADRSSKQRRVINLEYKILS